MIYQLIMFAILAVGTITAKYEVVYKAEASVFTRCPGPTLNWINWNHGHIKPDPVQWPGNVTFSGTLDVGRDDFGTSRALFLQLVVKRISPIGNVTIPWIESLAFGSRDIDFCGYLLPKYYHELCDKAGLCECPFKEGSYYIEFVKLLPWEKLTGLFVAGDYEVEAKIVTLEPYYNNFGCINFQFSIINTEESTSNKEKSLQCWFYEF